MTGTYNLALVALSIGVAIVGLATFGLLSVTLIISAFDAHSAKLTHSLVMANEQLRNMALRDDLTGLPNRLLLDDRLMHAIQHAERNRHRLAVLFGDLDRFKPVNDRFGHHIGDGLLKAVAVRLSAVVRGGDESVMVLGGLAKAEDAAKIGGKVISVISRPFIIEGHTLEISCSVGISIYPDDSGNQQSLLAKAAAAMYHAKNGGRNDFRFFVPDMRPADAGS